MIDRINQFYDNNGNNITETTQLVFRLLHLVKYHSDCETYNAYLSRMKHLFRGSEDEMENLYSLVLHAIPRHYGSYQYREGMLPLNLQGGKYRFYVGFNFEPIPIRYKYNPSDKNDFSLHIILGFNNENQEEVTLNMSYHLFSYLQQLCEGRLATSYENDRDMLFSTFLRELSKKCDQSKSLTIVDNNGKDMNLKISFNKPKLSL